MENNNITKKFGKLYIVSTPIGNKDDISLRAIKVLQSCDIVVCEEGKIGARLLHNYNINKPLEILNEHNEQEKSFELIKLLKEGKHLALTSDCGTPLFADPGILLVNQAIQNNIELHSIPGASSIMTGLVLSGFTVDRFLFAGFLSRDNDSRINQIKSLSKETKTVVVLETPYRIMPVLQAFADIIPYRKAYIGCNLTLPFETNHYGNFKDLYEKFRDLKFKGEFIIIFEKVLRKISKDKSENFNKEEKSESKRDGNGEFKRDDRKDFKRDGNGEFKRDDRKDFKRDDNREFKRDGNRESKRDGNREFRRGDRKDFKRDGNREFKRDDRKDFKRDGNREFKRDDNREFKRDDNREFKRVDNREFKRDDKKDFRRDDNREFRRDDKKDFDKVKYFKRKDRQLIKRKKKK